MDAKSVTLSHWATWSPNRYWVSDDRSVSLAYRRVGRVALVVTDPLGNITGPSNWVAEFSDFCKRRMWTPAFFCVLDETRSELASSGWRSFEIAKEAVVDLQSDTAPQKLVRKLRHAANRAKREGVSPEFTSWGNLSSRDKSEIRSLFETTPEFRKIPKLGFTVGSFKELAQSDVVILVVRNLQGHVIAFTSWSPVYEKARVIGRTLESIHRRSDTFNGISDFMVGEAINEFRSESLKQLSLSGIPLIGHLTDSFEGHRTLEARILHRFSKGVDYLYGNTGLYKFKKKFEPDFRSLYLVFRAKRHLFPIVLAVINLYFLTSSGFEID
jgi:phosphatidylglycerol lysyltransferase